MTKKQRAAIDQLCGTERATRERLTSKGKGAKSKKSKPGAPTLQAEPAEVVTLPKPGKRQKAAAPAVPDAAPLPQKVAKGSVVAAAYKAKAGKAGVWRADALASAVKEAFLTETTSDVEAAQAARLATDHILTENHLDAGRWAGKNAGMLSMNLRNVLRGLLRNDGVVFVYGKKIEA